MIEITEKLFKLQDKKYRAFQCSLIPNIKKEKVIGIRIPFLRKFAKELSDDKASVFIKELPHEYYDENNLHVFLIQREKDIDRSYELIEEFLPYIDNWATCDSMNPKILKKDKERLLSSIDRWMASDKIYTVRFGIGMLMRHFLGEDFKTEYPEKVAAIVSDEYYINMMCAWYFATALAKQYDRVLPFFENGILNDWVHNKAITKACESYRITKEHKEYLKKLRKKKTAE